VKSSSNSVKWHTQGNGCSNTSSGGKDSHSSNWTEEIVGILLNPIIWSWGSSQNSCDCQSVSKRSSKKGSFFRDLDKSINKRFIVSSALLWVHLISLHSCEDDFKWIRKYTCSKSSGDTCVSIKVGSSLSPSIRIYPIVEIEETPSPGSGVGNSSHSKSIKLGIHLPHASSGSEYLVINLGSMDSSFKSMANVAFSLLEHLGSGFDEIKWLGL